MNTKIISEEKLKELKTEDGSNFVMEQDNVRLETFDVEEKVSNPYDDQFYKGKLEELMFKGNEIVKDRPPLKGQIPWDLYADLTDIAKCNKLTLVRGKVKTEDGIMFQVGLIKCSADGTWEPVEVGQHPEGLTGAALVLYTSMLGGTTQ